MLTLISRGFNPFLYLNPMPNYYFQFTPNDLVGLSYCAKLRCGISNELSLTLDYTGLTPCFRPSLCHTAIDPLPYIACLVTPYYKLYTCILCARLCHTAFDPLLYIACLVTPTIHYIPAYYVPDCSILFLTLCFTLFAY